MVVGRNPANDNARLPGPRDTRCRLRRTVAIAIGMWAALVALLSTCIGFRTPLDERIPPDAGRDGTVGCTPGVVTLTRARPTVMFVLDRSTSMGTSMNGSRNGQTRWEALGAALATVLPPVDKSLAIGALIFPGQASLMTNCTVPGRADLQPATGNVAALTQLMNSYYPDGSTPTAAAIDTAAKLLLSMRTASMARALVLATDGGPDCNAGLNPMTCRCLTASNTGGNCSSSAQCLDDARTIKAIADYEAKGLPTYVIGIESQGDNQLDDVLNAMAIAGGRPQHGVVQSFYPASSAADLSAALTAIRDQVGACTYLTSSVPDQNGAIVITVDGGEIATDQWIWGNKNNGEILLLGDVCQTLANESAPKITASVQCSDS
jgi:von Willebrand factor type A domain